MPTDSPTHCRAPTGLAQEARRAKLMTHNASSSEEQSKRFTETARALGCDEDEQSFKDKLREIARQKPKGGDAPEEKKRKRPAS